MVMFWTDTCASVPAGFASAGRLSVAGDALKGEQAVVILCLMRHLRHKSHISWVAQARCEGLWPPALAALVHSRDDHPVSGQRGRVGWLLTRRRINHRHRRCGIAVVAILCEISGAGRAWAGRAQAGTGREPGTGASAGASRGRDRAPGARKR